MSVSTKPRRSSATTKDEIKRRLSKDSDGNSVADDMESVISESLSEVMTSHSNEPNHIAGYLLKQSKEGVWQKRYFETNSTFLTYYKSRKMNKLLAALNLATVGEISVVGNVTDNIGDGVIFQLELKDKNYILRTSSVSEAEKWMFCLRKLRDEAKKNVIPEDSTLITNTSSGETTSSVSAKREVETVPLKDKKGVKDAPNTALLSNNNNKIEISGDSDEKKKCCIIS